MYATARRLVSSALLLTVIAGCGEAAPWVTRLTTTEVEAPPGPRSGEPFVSSAEDGVYLSWLEAVDDEVHAFKVAHLGPEGWSEARTVATSASFFVNWADFPSVRVDGSGNLWAHWLERGGTSTYDYAVRIVHSSDGGRTWSDPWTPHGDGTPTEHGFVSAFPSDGGLGFVWLDGRETMGGHGGDDGHATRGAMTVRSRLAAVGAEPGPEMLLDDRVCDCCQTGAALTPTGPVVVYRDRSPEEIRDIYITRQVDGAWTEGIPVHDDGWEIAGCPVNGPAVAAVGEMLAVVWFTAANNVPRVKVAFSADDGATFGAPVVVDDGNPAGRVDLVELPDGRAGVFWLERTGGQGAEVRLKSVDPDGTMSDPVTISRSSSGRASGFPRAALTPDGGLLVAWTDASEDPMRVRVTKLTLED